VSPCVGALRRRAAGGSGGPGRRGREATDQHPLPVDQVRGHVSHQQQRRPAAGARQRWLPAAMHAHRRWTRPASCSLPRVAGLPGRAAAARPCSRFQAAGGQQPTWAHHRREDLCVPPHPAAGARYLARQPIMISRSTAARALVFAHAGACLFPPDPNRSRAAAAGSAPQARSQRAGTGAAPAGVTDLRTSDSAMAHRAAAASASVSRRLRQASARLQPIARRVSCTAP